MHGQKHKQNRFNLAKEWLQSAHKGTSLLEEPVVARFLQAGTILESN